MNTFLTSSIFWTPDLQLLLVLMVLSEGFTGLMAFSASKMTYIVRRLDLMLSER